jgi:hypothetical protein
MKASKNLQDVIDVHVTSNDTIVDCFSQYPLLAGEKKYTVQVTEFCCPLTTEPLPPVSFFEDDAGNTRVFFFEIRRRRATAYNHQMNTDFDSMSTLTVSDLPGAALLFPDDSYYKFRKEQRRKLSTVGGFVHSLHTFFRTFIQKYRTDRIDQSLTGDDHGGEADLVVQENTPLVTVRMTPNGTLRLVFDPIFTANFYLEFTNYGRKIFGIQEQILAFRQEFAVIHQGTDALLGDIGGITHISGGTDQSVEVSASHSIYRFFDQRCRLEIETQMGITPTNVWSTNGTQQLNTVIATFPIQTRRTVKVTCNSDGAVQTALENTDELLEGEIIWRKAEDKVTERYLLNDSKFFHNIRLELFIVNREWQIYENAFKFIRKKVTFGSGEYWTGKLRFRSL